MRCRLGVALLLAVVAASPVIAGQTPAGGSATQQSPPVFRSGVEAVRFEAIVTDKNGKPITDLAANDFIVREDDAPQTIEQFTRVVLPAPRPHQPPRMGVSPDVSRNEDIQDRVYVIVFDRMSWSQAVRGAQIVRRFLDEYFDDTDLAAVVSLEYGTTLRFTRDRQFLLEQANKFVELTSLPNLWRQQNARANVQPFGPLARDPLHEQRLRVADRAALFGEIGRSLSHVEARRKSIIYISRGLDIDPYDAVDMPKSSFSEDARAMLEPIMAGDLSVYPVHPGNADPLTSRTMRALAYVTGGVPTGTDITGALKQIVRDNSAYYVLGYQSTNPRRDGGFRHIHVEVKRKGAKVRARSGYFVEFPPDTHPDALFSFNGRIPPPPRFVPPTDLSPSLTTAMDSPVALTAVPMTVFAAAHKAAPQAGSQRAAVTVVVEIPAAGLDFARTDDEVTGHVDLAIGATSGLRTIRGTGFDYSVHLRGEARKQFDTHGLRLAAEVTLEPGEYRLGIAAGTRGGRMGKTFYDLTIPDFSQPRLAMSGVSLSLETIATTPTLQPAAIRPQLTGPVTASRLFDRRDTIGLYTEVYENVWWTDEAHTITLTTALVATDGSAVPVTTEERASRSPQLKNGGYAFTANLPLASVRPGAYVLRIEARSDFDTPRTVTREVPITIR